MSMAVHVRAMLELQKRGAKTFDYGNNIRGQAQKAGVAGRFRHSRLRSRNISGRSFASAKALSAGPPFRDKPQDIYVTDEAVLKEFPEDEALDRWIRKAQKQVKFQGLPARICWLGTASGRGSAPSSTTSSRKARSARRSSSAATISTRARWLRRTAKPRA